MEGLDDSEADLCRHGLTVFRTQMSVSARYQGRVGMTEPLCEREKINARLNCCRTKQMSKIVMTEPLDVQLIASAINRLLALPNRENVALTVPAPCVAGIGFQVVKQRSHCRNNGNPSAFTGLRAGMLVS